MKNKECDALSVAEGKTYETYKDSGIEWGFLNEEIKNEK